MKFYTGIGSRETPPDIIQEMKKWALLLVEMGFTLRSGSAQGADKAFETSCDITKGPKEIYLPWKGFAGNTSPLYNISEEALVLGERVYGARWKYLKRPVKLLHARNGYQVLGKNLDTPSDFVICWTKDGCENKQERSRDTGGTGQAISIASEFSIPVFNLKKPMSSELLLEHLKRYER